MSERTKISWCDSTVNFWSGCTKVSDGCKNCYAEALSDRKMTDAKGNRTIGQWGKGAPRRLHESAFRLALRLNRKPWVCDECGGAYEGQAPGVPIDGCACNGFVNKLRRRRIFSLSLADWLDPEVPVEWLARMLDTVRQCDQVVWMLCTKRPEQFRHRIYEAKVYHEARSGAGDFEKWLFQWFNGNPPSNIILLASVENQAMADKRIPELLRIPAACRGLSLEPLLGPVDIKAAMPREVRSHQLEGISWAIIGGESGPKARPCNVENIRSLVAQGKAAGVATYVKQFGAKPEQDLSAVIPEAEFNPNTDDPLEAAQWDIHRHHSPMHLKDKKGGDPSEWPADLRVQEWPKGF